ncbi:unnamed protein product [Brachionus calyciflorus]|uniref:Uncharacterized protein n=1 Tax=Brachionus calyciflorus TaxID=104777 RepID=A0A814CA40_9BILA|nr:unnamed protein product [Brachionus calyciflorus]
MSKYTKSLKFNEEILCLEIFGEKLFAGFFNGLIRIINNKNNCIIRTLTGHISYVFCLKLISKNTLASTAFEGSVKIWNIDSGNCLETIKGHCSSPNCLALSSKGDLFMGFKDGHIRVWDKEKWQVLNIFQIDNRPIGDLSVTENGEFLIRSEDNLSIRIFKPC